MNGARIVEEVAPATWRVQSHVGPRNLFQYVIAGGDEAVLIDAGTASTPRNAILPALRAIGVAAGHVRHVVVTHPDTDHQGGLAGLLEALPVARAECGFADRLLVADPERLIADRYGAFEHEHGLGYGADDTAWMRSESGAAVTLDATFVGGERIAVGNRALEIHHAPGHSAGHLVLFERDSGLLFSSDAVHWKLCPAADGSPALPPTYEDVDAYLATIDLVERLAPSELHSGHWLTRRGTEIATFCADSRGFVDALDAALVERLGSPATLKELCDHADTALGPFGAEALNLMFAVHGHLTRLSRRGGLERSDGADGAPRFRLRTPAHDA